MDADSLTYRIAFASYRSMTLGLARRFEGLGVTPEAFFTREARELAALTGVRAEYFGDRRRQETLARAMQEAAFVRGNGISALFHTDAAYPSRQLECDDAPAMLYFTGPADAAATSWPATASWPHWPTSPSSSKATSAEAPWPRRA